MLSRLRLALPVLLLAACDRTPPIAACSDDLAGVWRAPAGHWALIDDGVRLEGFALFDDTSRTADDALAAPRAVDLVRSPKPAGEVKRRYTRGADHCDARAPVHVTKCQGDALQVVIADPAPPLAFAPCTWGSPPTSRVERWARD